MLVSPRRKTSRRVRGVLTRFPTRGVPLIDCHLVKRVSPLRKEERERGARRERERESAWNNLASGSTTCRPAESILLERSRRRKVSAITISRRCFSRTRTDGRTAGGFCSLGPVTYYFVQLTARERAFRAPNCQDVERAGERTSEMERRIPNY